MGYRLVIAHSPPEKAMTFAAQVDTGTPRGWVTVATWDCQTPPRLPGKARVDLVHEQAGEHGWAPRTSEWPRPVNGTFAIDVMPSDWRAVLIAATRHRAEQLESYEAADLARRLLVAEVQASTNPAMSGRSTLPRWPASPDTASTKSKG